MFTRLLFFLAAAAAPALTADWNVRAAASYLDSRQKDWFAWPVANRQGTPCLSCHTGLTYLLARPVLRRALAESAPVEYETGLLDSLRAGLKRPSKGGPPRAPKLCWRRCCWRAPMLPPACLPPKRSRPSTGFGGSS